MRFGKEVVRFDYAGIPMVGNLSTGYAIGLTDEGACLCDDLLVSDVETDRIAAVDEALFQHLGKGGFFDESSQQPQLVSAYLHVTQRCNLDCIGCYSFNDQRNHLGDASLASFKHAIFELSRAGLVNLVVSGGEPFLRDDLAEMMRYAKHDCKIPQVSVLSNGTLIREADLSSFAGMVDRISVSFDGISPESVAFIRREQRFTQLVEAVQAVRAAGIPAHIIATIHAKNHGDIAAYHELAKDLGATISLSLLSCSGDTDDLGELLPNEATLKQLGKELFELGSKESLSVLDAPVGQNISVKQVCEAGKKILSIAADGTVYPCHMLHVGELAMGNLFSGDIEEVIHSGIAMMFGSLCVDDFDGCGTCSYKWMCGGGCRGRSLAVAGNLHAKDGYCSMITEFYGGLGESLRERYQAKERG